MFGTAALGGRKNAVFVRQLETVILRIGNLLAPEEHGGVQGCCFKAAVRADLPGRAADIHLLTVGKTVINALRHNEGFVFLPLRHALQRDNALCGAHYIVHAQLAVDGQQQRIVLVAVNCADLQNVLQLIQSGKRRGGALALFG